MIRCSHGEKTHNVLQGGGTTEGEVLKFCQEEFSVVGLPLEFNRVG